MTQLTLHTAFALCLLATTVQAHDAALHKTAPTDLIATSGEEALILPNYPVEGAQGLRGTLRSLLPAEAPVILSFTYTGCESLCDITNAVLLGVDDLLREGDDGTRIVTLSIDPVHDTPNQLESSREELGTSDRWLWLTAGVRGTAPLLDALRFPPGRIEDHDPVFLIGRVCSGRFIRIVGLPAPEDLISYARALPPCAS
jgi:protein SCO1/2